MYVGNLWILGEKHLEDSLRFNISSLKQAQLEEYSLVCCHWSSSLEVQVVEPGVCKIVERLADFEVKLGR